MSLLVSKSNCFWERDLPLSNPPLDSAYNRIAFQDAIRKAVEEYKEKKGIEDDDDVDIYLKDTQVVTFRAIF